MTPMSERDLNERDLKRLLAPPHGVEPPAGLADRIKAEIPDDLAAPATSPEPASVVPFPAARWLAAAALLAVMAGGSLLAYRLLQPELAPLAHDSRIAESRAEEPESTGAFEDEKREIDAPREEIGWKAEPADAPTVDVDLTTAEAGATAADVGTEVSEVEAAAPAPVEQARRQDAPAAAPSAAGPAAKDDLRIRSEIPRPMAKNAPAREAQPRDAGSPDAGRPDAGRRDAAYKKEELRARLEALGYVSDQQTAPEAARRGGAPRVEAASPPPPPPAPRATASRAEPEPHVNYRIEVDNAAIRALEAEAKALEEEMRHVEGAASAAPPSTGGTAEPNDAPYGDVFFEGYGVNPFVDVEDDPLSTFGLDVDTGSYTVVRRYLTDGHLPPREAVRVEELVNYFDYGDPPPAEGDFALHAEGAPAIFGEGERYYLLRLSVKGREVSERARPPAVLVFTVDVSGSMAREDRLGLVKRALGLLLDELRPDDRVGLVTYGSYGRVLLEPTADRSRIRRALEALVPEGSTNAEEGLRLAYELASRHRRPGSIHRVVLCSDGVANTGRTSAGAILPEIRRYAREGIELTTVGFGMGNYNDVLMEQLADAGNGRYAYVDVLEEARRVFVENLTGTLQTIAAEARAQVRFAPETVARYRLLGYENRDVADERFRDDTVDAGEIGAGHAVTVLYEVKLHRDLRELRESDEIATVFLRWGSVAAKEMVETERRVTAADFAASWERASRALRLSALVAEYAEILKGAYWARGGDMDEVFRRAQRLSAEYRGRLEVADFAVLAGRAAELMGE